jgi:hypothetical protein
MPALSDSAERPEPGAGSGIVPYQPFIRLRIPTATRGTKATIAMLLSHSPKQRRDELSCLHANMRDQRPTLCGLTPDALWLQLFGGQHRQRRHRSCLMVEGLVVHSISS